MSQFSFSIFQQKDVEQADEIDMFTKDIMSNDIFLLHITMEN